MDFAALEKGKTMTKYIDAVTAAEKISQKHGIPLADLVDTLADIPAADVAEVVRCKDCKYSGMYCFGTSKEETLACLETEEDGFIRFATSVKADDYCSRGERKMDKEVADDKKQPEEAPGE